MKILVPVKRVVDYNVKVRAKSDESGPDLSNAKMAINPFCEIAIEEAVRIKEAGKAEEIIAVSVGDSSSQEQLRTCLALGADRAILVETSEVIEPLGVAKALKEVVGKENPDLIILGKQAMLKNFEKESANFFEACLPIEEIARRGIDTMRFGPLKSIGLWNPKWGDLFDRENRLKNRPHAIVQLRMEDLQGKLVNMVGFQTNLKWSEQKRIFRMIPGLEKAEFVRFGVMHRNTFLESPKLLLPTLQFMKRETLLAAGQITGTEGYAAAAAGGLLAGINASLLAMSKKTITFPDESMIGSLINFISNRNQMLSNHKKSNFQPMPASFGLVPELTKRIKDKRLRYKAYQERSTEALSRFKEILDSRFEKDHLLIKIH